jgi:DNA-binding response OmpR family regulator
MVGQLKCAVGNYSETIDGCIDPIASGGPEAPSAARLWRTLLRYPCHRGACLKRVLIIEDDRDIVELVRYNLSQEGFDLSSASDGIAGLTQVRKSQPDLLLLDLMLPKMPGLEVCREIRRDPALNRLPILMLTARGEEADRVVGLEMGADDYVTKPFSPRELVARVKALLRRTTVSEEVDRPIEAGELVIDPSAYRVTRAGAPVTLSTLEFRLLHHLASRRDRVFTRDQLLDAVWGSIRQKTPREDRIGPRKSQALENSPWGGLPV